MPTIHAGGEMSFDEAIDRLAAARMRPRDNFQCAYVRRVGNQFQLVAQWVNLIGDNFTFDEEVLTTGPTPRDVLNVVFAGLFDMPPHPSMRE